MNRLQETLRWTLAVPVGLLTVLVMALIAAAAAVLGMLFLGRQMVDKIWRKKCPKAK